MGGEEAGMSQEAYQITMKKGTKTRPSRAARKGIGRRDMDSEKVVVESFKIDAQGLDPIHAFWMNVGPGQGYVTLICYGNAWTAYFGAMGANTIQEFFRRADVGYLTSKLGGQFLKASKRHDNYLGKIILAVKASLPDSPKEPANAE
jgi:hypothetical protein